MKFKKILLLLLFVGTLITLASCSEKSKMCFGTYPQTKVKATTENGLSSITFDSTWNSYKYYIAPEQQDFMYYKDVDIDNNGTLDYRGVYFTQYRPCSLGVWSESNSYQDDNRYFTNHIYWFSYDPIEWKIITKSGGKALILADLILDSQEYYLSKSTSSFFHNDGVGYANDYELSNIRRFLNETFYNMAFTTEEKSLIESTIVDNSASTTNSSSSYACPNTEDKLFLLSFSEVTSSDYGLNSTEVRQTKGTDYAKCQGLQVSGFSTSLKCSFWWLRSPYLDSVNRTCVIGLDGKIGFGDVHFTSSGVRPACWINL